MSMTSKKILFGLIALAITAFAALFILKHTHPDLLDYQSVTRHWGAPLLSLCFFYFAFVEFHVARNPESESFARVSGMIRVPFYTLAGLFLLYWAFLIKT